MTRDIHIHIDRLVLDGVSLGGLSPGAVSEQVRAGLEALLDERGIEGDLANGGARGAIRGGDLTGPGHLGTRIARSIHAGLSGDAGRKP